MHEDERINRFVAEQQNLHDHITRRLFGPSVRFEQLSAFGQNTVEKMAREEHYLSDIEPEIRTAKIEVVELRRQIEEYRKQLAYAKQREQDLFDENEELKIELYEQEISGRRSAGIRKVYPEHIDLPASDSVRSDHDSLPSESYES